MPVIYRNEDAVPVPVPVPVSYPFILDGKGQINILQPDTNHPRTLKLYRKYPLSYTVKLANQRFRKAVVEASNDPFFEQKDSLGIFEEVSLQQYTAATIASLEKYRYWRIRFPDYFAVAECILSDSSDNRIMPELHGHRHTVPCEKAFDDNPVSYAYSDDKGIFSFDMGRAVVIERIECLLRNDGNHIWPGHWYELNYHAGVGWYSLGAKEAQERFVEFENVPANALLWLRDLTSGKEERIFTCMDNQIRFW